MFNKILVLASLSLGNAALGAPNSHTIDCHQNGDGFLDFTLTVSGKNAVLTTDTYHTPFKALGGQGRIDHLARLTLKSFDDIAFGAADPYLVSMFADASKLEYLDYTGHVTSTVNAPGLHIILGSFHGPSFQLYEAADTIGYQIEVSNNAGKSVLGNLWYRDPDAGGNSAYSCKVH